MTKRMWALIAMLAVAAAFPAAGATRQSGGTLNMIAWEGYLEPQLGEAVREAERLHCPAEVRDGSSDEMVTLMRSGGGTQYDMVSASGDASLRLIYGKDVQAVDVSKIPNFKKLQPGVPVAAEQHRRRQALRHLVAVGPEPPPLQHAEGEARADVVELDLLAEVQGQGHGSRQPDPDRGRRAVPDEDEAGARDQGPIRAQLDAVQRDDCAAQAAEAADQALLAVGRPGDQRLQERQRRGSVQRGRIS